MGSAVLLKIANRTQTDDRHNSYRKWPHSDFGARRTAPHARRAGSLLWHLQLHRL